MGKTSMPAPASSKANLAKARSKLSSLVAKGKQVPDAPAPSVIPPIDEEDFSESDQSVYESEDEPDEQPPPPPAKRKAPAKAPAKPKAAPRRKPEPEPEEDDYDDDEEEAPRPSKRMTKADRQRLGLESLVSEIRQALASEIGDLRKQLASEQQSARVNSAAGRVLMAG